MTQLTGFQEYWNWIWLDEICFASRTALWAGIVAYNHSRISSYIPTLVSGLHSLSDDLRARAIPSSESVRAVREGLGSFTKCERLGKYSLASHKYYMHFAEQRLDCLDVIINQALSDGKHGDELHTIVLQKVYALRYLKCVRVHLQGSLPPKSASRLIKDIAFLGRLSAAFRTFLDCASSLFPQFIRIRLQPKEPVAWPILQRQTTIESLSLKEVLHTLSTVPSDAKDMSINIWTSNK